MTQRETSWCRRHLTSTLLLLTWALGTTTVDTAVPTADESNGNRAVLLVHVPKTSGTNFAKNYGYGATTALGRTLRGCGDRPESHWPRLFSGKPHALWDALARGECNFIAAHSPAERAVRDVANVTGRAPLTFTFLRQPVARVLSLYAFACQRGGCRSGGGGLSGWAPPALKAHGLAALVNASLCPPAGLDCWQRDDEGPLWGNQHTFYFADVAPTAAAVARGVDASGSPDALAEAAARLATLDAVLLVEHMDASLCLFYWVGSRADGVDRRAFQAAFDAECATDRDNRNVDPRRANRSPHRTQVDAAFLRDYRDVVRNDLELYERGRQLFCAQMRAMADATSVAFPDVELHLCSRC